MASGGFNIREEVASGQFVTPHDVVLEELGDVRLASVSLLPFPAPSDVEARDVLAQSLVQLNVALGNAVQLHNHLREYTLEERRSLRETQIVLLNLLFQQAKECEEYEFVTDFGELQHFYYEVELVCAILNCLAAESIIFYLEALHNIACKDLVLPRTWSLYVDLSKPIRNMRLDEVEILLTQMARSRYSMTYHIDLLKLLRLVGARLGTQISFWHSETSFGGASGPFTDYYENAEHTKHGTLARATDRMREDAAWSYIEMRRQLQATRNLLDSVSQINSGLELLSQTMYSTARRNAIAEYFRSSAHAAANTDLIEPLAKCLREHYLLYPSERKRYRRDKPNAYQGEMSIVIEYRREDADTANEVLGLPPWEMSVSESASNLQQQIAYLMLAHDFVARVMPGDAVEWWENYLRLSHHVFEAPYDLQSIDMNAVFGQAEHPYVLELYNTFYVYAPSANTEAILYNFEDDAVAAFCGWLHLCSAAPYHGRIGGVNFGELLIALDRVR